MSTLPDLIDPLLLIYLNRKYDFHHWDHEEDIAIRVAVVLVAARLFEIVRKTNADCIPTDTDSSSQKSTRVPESWHRIGGRNNKSQE